jgi:hypothetical protein
MVVCIFSYLHTHIVRSYPFAVEIFDFWLFSCIDFPWRLSRWSHFGFLHFSRGHFQFYVHHLSTAETTPEKNYRRCCCYWRYTLVQDFLHWSPVKFISGNNDHGDIFLPVLKVHKIEIFFGFDFEICIISLLVM